jgi:hypothetical protein
VRGIVLPEIEPTVTFAGPWLSIVARVAYSALRLLRSELGLPLAPGLGKA